MSKFSFVFLFSMIPFLLAGCQKQASPAPAEKETVSEITAEEEEEKPQEEEEMPREETEETEVPEWASLTLVLDGQSLTLPFAYSEISDSWTLDPESEAFSEDTVLEPGQRTRDGIPLISEEWGDMLISAGFMNDSDQPKPLSQCSIWVLSLDSTWAEEEGRPSLSLPGEITWGDSAEAVREAYGSPSVEPFYSESMYYSSYSYSWEYLRELDMVIYDEQGLTMVTVKLLD